MDANIFMLGAILFLLTTALIGVVSSMFNRYKQWVEEKALHQGEDIYWHGVNLYIVHHGLAFEAYGLKQPKKQLNSVKTVKQIRKELANFIEQSGTNIHIKELSYNMIMMNSYGHPYMSNSLLFQNKTLPQFISLKEALQLTELGYTADQVAVLKYAGLTFNQIVAAKNLPIDWVIKMYQENET